MKSSGVSAPLTAILFTAFLLSIISYSLFLLPLPPSSLLKENLLQEAVSTLDYLLTLADAGPIYVKQSAVIAVPPNTVISFSTHSNSLLWRPPTPLHIVPHNPGLVDSYNASYIKYNASRILILTNCTLGPGVHRVVIELFATKRAPVFAKITSS
ncbi:MAG: hypothetical protein J7L98_05340 [Candidatus Verstraetearchaeota archaeon]|nr:hypothetical protein [Candidatus Verstraetearchaeota archaeon]